MDQKGVALMMTLWVMVLLAVMAMSFSLSARYGSAAVRNFKEDVQGRFLAVSAIEEGIAYLVTDKDPEVDFIDGEGNFWTDQERETVSGERDLDGAVVKLRISDEESRVNLNLADSNVLRRLLVDYAGADDEEAEEIIDSLADWKDPDDLHRLLGAEDEYYETMGYSAKDAVLDVPEELMLVKGFRPEIYYGTEETAALMDIVTTWGEGINVNTAPEAVLMAYGLSALDIDTIMSQRESLQGLRAVPQALKGIGRTASSNFRIEATARVDGNPMAIKVTAIIRITRGLGVVEPRTLYWKETLESSGA